MSFIGVRYQLGGKREVNDAGKIWNSSWTYESEDGWCLWSIGPRVFEFFVDAIAMQQLHNQCNVRIFHAVFL